MTGKDSIMISHPPFCDRTCGICGSCYSKKMSKYRKYLQKRQDQNTKVLNKPGCIIHKFNTLDRTIRWLSTGELWSDQMFENICLFAIENNHLYHVIWTKRAGIVRRCSRIIPNNLGLIWSATKIDYPKPFVPKGFDIGFWVYSSEDKLPDNAIHCTKKCSTCGFCYRPGSKGIVCEVLK